MLNYLSFQESPFKIPVSSLNASEWELFPITVVFDTSMGKEKWYCKYDFKFKEELSSTLNNCPFLQVCTNYMNTFLFLQQLD